MAQSVGAVALDIVMGKNTVSSAVSRVADDAKRSFGGMSGNVSAVNKVLKETQGDLSEVDRLLKIDPRNTVLLEQKQRMLNSSISDTKLKLSELETASAKANKELANGDITQAQYDELQREIIGTEQDLKSLEAQAKQTSPEMLKITQTQEDFKNLGSKISGVGSACKQLGKSLLPASAAATGVIASTTKAAMSFETSMAQVKTIAGNSAVSYKGNMTDMSKAIMQLSTDTGIAAEDIAGATYNAISAGVDVSKSVEFVATANALAVGGFTDMTTSVDVLTTTLNAYGDKAGTAESISDKLITTQNLGKTTVNELASSMGRVIPTASAYCVSVDNLCASYVALTKGGIATAEATTYMKSMFNELADSGSTVGEILQEKTGMSFGQLMESGMSLADVIDILGQSVNGDAEAFAQLWGSSEAGTGALAILNGGTADFNNTLKEMGNSTGAASSAMDKMNDTSAHKMQVAMNNMKNAAIELGGAFAPVMSGIAKVVGTVATAFSNLPAPVKTVIAVILGVVAVAAPLLLTIGSVITAVTTITGVIGPLVAGIGGVTAVLNPVTLAIGAVVAAGALLIANWDKVKAAAGAVKDWVVEKWNALKEKTSEAWNNIKEKTSQAWEGIKSKVKSAADKARESASNAWQGMKQRLSSLGEGIKNGVSNAWSATKNAVSNFANGAKNAAQSAWQGMKNAVSTVGSGIKTTASNCWSGIKSTVSTLANGAKSAATKAWQGIKSGIQSHGGGIQNAVSNCFNGAKSTITSFASQAVGWGKDFASGLASGIKSAAGKVVNAAKGLGSKIKSFLHFSRPDEGPLRDYETWMPDFVQGMANGIEQNKYKLIDSVKSMASQMIMPAIQAPALKNVGTGTSYTPNPSTSTSDDRLYGLLSQLVAGIQKMGDITVPVYLGNDLIDEQIVRANDRRTLRSGGRA